MARGWESKSVESQIDEALDRSTPPTIGHSSELAKLQAERASIQLSRERILREIAESVHPRHREQLTAALAYLDGQLAKLGLESFKASGC